MKKMMMTALVAGVLAATVNGAYAQSALAFSAGVRARADLSVTRPDPVMNEGGVKALRHFHAAFGGVSGVQWSAVVGGYMAQFANEGVVTRVFYDAGGNWRHTIRYYDGKKLSAGVRSLVRSVYYDYAILSVEEVKLVDKTVYLVNIEGDKKGMTIRVCEDEMEVEKEYCLL